MHMADALVSTPVALAAGVTAISLLGIAGSQIKKRMEDNIIPLMGVVGAFVFAAQMINFSIPGTGSSGHIIGGILLAALLGSWAGFFTLSSVIIIQCLIFADGGLLALGCNILNMGAMTCLVAYPLVYKPLIKYPASAWRIFTVSILACTIGLELGACMVWGETMLSGVTALSPGKFFLLITSIHLAIGVGEGLATGAVLVFIERTRPSLLVPASASADKMNKQTFMAILLVASLVIGGVMVYFASTNPDGLEWSIAKLTDNTLLPTSDGILAKAAENVQASTSLLPDYENSFSGIIGAVMVMVTVWGLTSILMASRKKKPGQQKISVSNEKS